MNPELLKKLIATFGAELEEQAQVMTNGLLSLEKGLSDQKRRETIESIFRSAHNIKGASRGIGIIAVGDIAHRIESLFSAIQKNEITVSRALIDLCLEAIDKMHLAMKAFVDKQSLDISELVARLDEMGSLSDNTAPNAEKIKVASVKKTHPQKTYPESSNKEFIRVPLTKIDKVSSLMEEIQVNKISIEDYYSEINHLAERTKQLTKTWKQFFSLMQPILKSQSSDTLQRLLATSNDDITEIDVTATKLSKGMKNQLNEFSMISSSLQEEVRLLRLVPASYLFSTLPRYVRDISLELNKHVDLHVEGDSVSMDNLILEGLKDPIIHIIRNAIDHGIEDFEIRKKLGKSEIGHINIVMRDEGSEVVIDISDDGAGVDIDAIKRIAMKKGIISQSELETLNESQLLNLIFRPGFSTKEIITDISGRGVGLDVVKDNINKLKGDVIINSVPNQGTSFSLRLPLMLSSERGLLVKASDQFFVLPTHSVEHVWNLQASDIVEVGGTQAVILDDKPIPLKVLSLVLGLEKQDFSTSDNLSVVVIKSSGSSMALLVNEVLGEREIVVKSLSKPALHVPCVSGVTLLERNQVVLVLNPLDIFSAALQRGTAQIHVEDMDEKMLSRPRILVVDDSITTRTLEKNILESNNFEVTVAVNGKEAWDILQKEQFNLVITDVNMPIMDGFVLTNNIKQHERLKAIPVIIVTSLGSASEKAHGIEVGADAYIVKNEFESDALLQIVGQLI